MPTYLGNENEKENGTAQNEQENALDQKDGRGGFFLKKYGHGHQAGLENNRHGQANVPALAEFRGNVTSPEGLKVGRNHRTSIDH